MSFEQLKHRRAYYNLLSSVHLVGYCRLWLIFATEQLPLIFSQKYMINFCFHSYDSNNLASYFNY
jgi:hypothetical protein